MQQFVSTSCVVLNCYAFTCSSIIEKNKAKIILMFYNVLKTSHRIHRYINYRSKQVYVTKYEVLLGVKVAELVLLKVLVLVHWYTYWYPNISFLTESNRNQEYHLKNISMKFG